MAQPTEREDRYARAERALEEFYAERAGGPGALTFEDFAQRHPDLSAELRELYAACADVDGALLRGQQTFTAHQAAIQRMLAELRSQPGFEHRYSIEGELGKGGMGVVYRVVDRKLERPLAMKLILGQANSSDGSTSSLAPRHLQRFLNEAKITGQLDHPGIVPVHEVGVDAQGRAFFTMKLVQGRTLGEVFRRQEEGDPEWTKQRILALLQRACQALAYAHERGVIHRDLKPANVMVGDFGEVYVMDWGLARRLVPEDSRGGGKDSRITGSSEDASTSSDPDPLEAELTLTRQGAVLGTPAYMPPEQAAGMIDAVGPHSDVYALGAMLYQLIAGHAPYCGPGEDTSGFTVLRRIVAGPPKRLASQNTAPELIAICERAMEREAKERYPDVRGLAADLGAFLEGRVVKAYESGAWAEARTWIARNRGLAATGALAIGAIVVGAVAFAFKAQEALDNARVAVENQERAVVGEKLAQEQKARADREAEAARTFSDQVLSLSAMQKLEDLVRTSDQIWPVRPESVRVLEDWLGDAQELVDKLPEFRAKLANLSSRPFGTEGNASGAPSDISDQEARWWAGQLAKLIASIEELQRGLMSVDGVVPDHGWSIPKRLAHAERLRDGLAVGGDLHQAWEASLSAIRSAYPSLEIVPQINLVPLGPDPHSGLWEFADLQTGEPPQRAPDGRLTITEQSALVFVLLPGGECWIGAQSRSADSQNYDPDAPKGDEPMSVQLSPFLISKYEVSQGQWARTISLNPSGYPPDAANPAGNCATGQRRDMTCPVESVTCGEAEQFCARLGLALPSEAQWEHAARGRTSTPRWFTEVTDFQYVDNIADACAKQHSSFPGIYETWNDGWTVPAPVDFFDPNPFGLHSLLGNVWEMCSDGWLWPVRLAGLDPVSPHNKDHQRVRRGGHYLSPAREARSASRSAIKEDYRGPDLGFRPVRALDHP
jgi:serine/threonine protein kinase/formylglycine-generating enzyme required for sulfatase activity